MGRRKQVSPHHHAKEHDSVHFGGDDSRSQSSACTSSWGGAGLADDEVIDGWTQAVDDLFEKRGSTREKALAGLLGFLREDVRQEDAMNSQTTIISRSMNSIRRGSNLESVLASQVLGMLFVTLPEPSEAQLQEVLPELQRGAKSGGSPEARVAAVEAIAMCCFAAAEDDHTCLEVMGSLVALWASARDSRTLAAALRAWALLFTRLHRMLGSAAVEPLLGRLAALLHAPDVEVRGAAGEVLALLYHCNLRCVFEQYADAEEAGVGQAGAEEEEEGDGEEDSWVDGVQVAATSSSEGEGHALGEVVGRLRQLAAAHHTAEPLRRSRRDKAAQRATFRGVLAVVEAGRVPTTKVKLPGDMLVVDTMQGNVMLAGVKKYLAGGFQTHLQHNPQLHAWFDFTPSTTGPERMSALDKRHFKSPSSQSSRYRTSERKGQRAFKASRHAPAGDDDY